MVATDRLAGLNSSVAVKAPCKAASNSNITLSGEQTVGSVPCVDGDRVLVAAQSDATENGIYVCSTSAWSRAADFDGNRDVVNGTLVVVTDDDGSGPGSFFEARASWPRTAAEIAASVVPTSLYFKPGDVRRYGAVGDGTTNDTAAFQAAFNQNVRSESDAADVYAPQSTYYFATGTTWCAGAEDHKVFNSDGAKVITDQNITPFTIGPGVASVDATTGEAMNCRILGHLHVEYTGSTVPASLTNNGFLFSQVYQGAWNISAKFFKYGVQLVATDSGCHFNTFYFGEVNRCWRGLWLNPKNSVLGGGDGSVNANNFYNGRFAGYSGGTSEWFIYLRGTSGDNIRPNGNTFHNPSFETPSTGGTTCQGAYYDGGSYNSLLYPRIEMDSDKVEDEQILYSIHSFQGHFFGARDGNINEFAGTPNHSVLDLGRENRIFADDGLHWSAARSGHAGTMLQLKRDRKNTSEQPMVEVVDYNNTADPSQTYQSVLNTARSADADSYHFRAQTTGSLVSQLVSATEYSYYECINGHSSGAANAPPSSADPDGGADWRTYWVAVNGDFVNSDADGTVGSGADHTALWATSQSYTGRVEKFKVDGAGAITTDSTINSVVLLGGSGAPTSSSPKGAIYLRTGGTGTNQIIYVNTATGNNWVAADIT